MKIKQFKKIVKEEPTEKILEKYMKCIIYLTDKQLSEVLKNSKGHGGANFTYVDFSSNE